MPPAPEAPAQEPAVWAPPVPRAAASLGPPDPTTLVAANYVEPRRRGGRTIAKAVGAAVASAVIPGLGQACQRRWRAALLFALPMLIALAVGIWAVTTHDRATLVDWGTDSTVLRALFAGGLGWALLCAISAGEALRARWPSSSRRGSKRANVAGATATAVVAVVALVPGLAGAWASLRQDRLLDQVFTGSGEDVAATPSPLEDLGITTTAPTTAPPTTRAATAATTATTAAATTASPTTPAPTTAAAPPTTPAAEPAGRWTIALLGGDAGPRRWNLRTDTMIVVSIDRQTGDLASISVPRNLQKLPMPAGPLRQRFPRGFDDLANALYPYVATHPELKLDPAQSVKGALAELLGIPIHNYVLVDMAGFVKIIDALGGVTVDLSKRVPLVPNMDGKTKEAPYVGPGVVRMNGTMALSFVRTRNADSDYQRMSRQRCLLGAVAREVSPTDLALNYPSLASAVEGAFRSDIPRDKLGDLVRLFGKVNVDAARTLVFVPPVITPARPDVARIRQLVAATLDAGAAAREPAIGKPTC